MARMSKFNKWQDTLSSKSRHNGRVPEQPKAYVDEMRPEIAMSHKVSDSFTVGEASKMREITLAAELFDL